MKNGGRDIHSRESKIPFQTPLILSEVLCLHFDHERLYLSLLGPPGLKGQKGIMGRYGKMGPPGLKGGVG